jgi:phosphatidylethanolamine/phosphatidyl-N-methylethanolamine N-methyltransferase
MLEQARRKAEREKLDHIRLVKCNALEPPFAEGTFDCIFLSHVISVVQDPPALINVIKRLGKPGCRIVIINHFKSSNRLIGLIEHWLNPLCKKLGWRSDLTLQELVDKGGLQIDFQYKLAVFDIWRTVFAVNADPPRQITTIPYDGPRPEGNGNGH